MARALIRIGRLRATGALRLRLAIPSAKVKVGASKRQAGAPSLSLEPYVHEGC